MTEWAYFADISNNNGALDAATIDADAVICKASEGGGFTDRYRAGWQAALQAVGKSSGNYHFHRGSATPAAQLARWKDSGLGVGELRPIIDAEDPNRSISPSAMARSVLELAELITDDQGVDPIIYTGGWWIGQYCTPDPALARYPLWLSAYPLGDKRPPSDTEAAQWFAVGKYCAPPAPWTETFAWQFTSIAATPGVPGHCDRSIISIADLAAFHRNALQPSTQEDDMPATLVMLPDDKNLELPDGTKLGPMAGAVIAIPSNGARPWHIPSNDAKAILRISGAIGDDPHDALTDPKQIAAALAMLAKG